MSITIVTASETYDLTTLTRVKRELGLTDTTNDDWLADIIHEESENFAILVNRVLAQEVVTETLNMQRSGDSEIRALVLKRYPVTAISAVSVDGTALETTEYEWDERSGEIWRLSAEKRIAWAGTVATISYTGGYELLGTLPRPIEAAVLTMIKTRWFSSRRDPSVRSEEAVGVQRLTFFDWSQSGAVTANLPPTVRNVVENFKDIRSSVA